VRSAATRQRFIARSIAVRASLLVLALASGCATASKQVKTARYTLTMPDFWEVKSEGMTDGAPTSVIIGRYGSAIIDEGAGAIEPRAMNYEAVQADVQVRIYGWPQLQNVTDASAAVAQLLAGDPELKLTRHIRLPDQPPECGLLKKKYDILHVPTEPIDLVSRPGWRTIVIGGIGEGSLLGVVARVEYEQDVGRYCHNLSNLRVQLQNLLDGLVAVPQPSAPVRGTPAAAPSSAPPASPPAGAAPPAPVAAPPPSGS
jgi:hypothetical protein